MPDTNEYTCTTSEARVYTLKGHAKNYGRWWAEITIKEWPGGGSLNVQSDCGSYANFWTRIGEGCLRSFLSDLGFDYFMEKTLGRYGYKEFDDEATIKAVRSDIIRGRREGWLDKDDAADLWDDIGMVESLARYHDEQSFFTDLEDYDKYSHRLYNSDMSSFPFRYNPRQECLNFWNHIWPCACEVWKKELENV